MSYLHQIQRCNRYVIEEFTPLYVKDELIAWVYPTFAHHLKRWPDVFSVSQQAIHIHPALTTPQTISDALAPLLITLHQEGIIDTWVGESYPVIQQFGEAPRFYLERAATHYLGMRSFGVHINGLVKKDEGLYVWVGRRAKDKPFWPGQLDQIVAGGQPAHISLIDNVIKESAEEANIPEALARQAHYIGDINYCSQGKRGLSPDTIFVYDLYLPSDFIPENTDGEVDEFKLISIDTLAELTEHTDEFKDNCNLVNIDLLLRQGLINAQHPDYEQITSTLYRPLTSMQDLSR